MNDSESDGESLNPRAGEAQSSSVQRKKVRGL